METVSLSAPITTNQSSEYVGDTRDHWFSRRHKGTGFEIHPCLGASVRGELFVMELALGHENRNRKKKTDFTGARREHQGFEFFETSCVILLDKFASAIALGLSFSDAQRMLVKTMCERPKVKYPDPRPVVI